MISQAILGTAELNIHTISNFGGHETEDWGNEHFKDLQKVADSVIQPMIISMQVLHLNSTN